MMVFREQLDRLKKKKLLIVLYWGTRIGMGLGFILSGIRKPPGLP
jgi:hypothetical protein